MAGIDPRRRGLGSQHLIVQRQREWADERRAVTVSVAAGLNRALRELLWFGDLADETVEPVCEHVLDDIEAARRDGSRRELALRPLVLRPAADAWEQLMQTTPWFEVAYVYAGEHQAPFRRVLDGFRAAGHVPCIRNAQRRQATVDALLPSSRALQRFSGASDRDILALRLNAGRILSRRLWDELRQIKQPQPV
jgi:hypothetical protein